MPWFMVDDKLHGNKKAARTPVEAMGLWVLAGSWCADHLTDGFIPDYVAKRLDPRATRHAGQLVAGGFWIEACREGDTGWQFHDWTQIQPTRAEVEKKRSEARERMRRVRTRSQEVRANDERSSDAVTPTPAQPSPAHPIRSTGSGSGEGSPSVSETITRPPRYCPKHPKGTDDPCGKCADARKDYESWKPPTLSGKTTMCGEHPKRRALNCPECASETTSAPEGWRAS